jgi:phosphatidylglycerophosphatase A
MTRKFSTYWQKIAHFLGKFCATLGPVGFWRASGTWASVVAFLPLAYAQSWAQQALNTHSYHVTFTPFYLTISLPYLALCFFIMIFSWYTIKAYLAHAKTTDPCEVVIDEVAGMAFALITATSWPSALLALVLFRVFDIAKPWPVGWADQKLHGAWGVLLDDVLAGIMAAVGVGVATHYVVL